MKPIPARSASGSRRPLSKLGFASFTAIALTSLAPLVANAQDRAVEEVVITGSRLTSNPNLVAPTPVLSVSGDEGAVRGNVRIEDFVNVMPQVFAGQASEVSNGASGTATLNLRGLGSQRTLVLIDGRRLPYGSSSISSANIDLVPLQMVERVDILTGGASAVYGSDAVSGVANFILKNDFEGVEFGGQYGYSYSDNDDPFFENILKAASQPVPGSKSDGDERMIYGMMGLNSADGRGNATLFLSYEDRDAITQANRVHSGCALGQDTGPQSFGGFGCVGSGNFRAFGGPGGFVFQEENGDFVPFAGGPAQTFNFGPFNFFQRPSERYQLYAKGFYEISDTIDAFTDFSYTNNFSDAQIAPSASFGRWQMNCDNPLLSQDLLDSFGCTPAEVAMTGADRVIKTNIFASHRNVEGGPRNSSLENSAYRLSAGLRGSFLDNWEWEAFAQTSETRDQSASTNDFVVAKVQQAFLIEDDGMGNAVCTDTTGGCVPYNIFQRGSGGESLVSAAALNFIQGIGLVNGKTSQVVYGGSIQGDLGEYGWQLPSADYGIRFLAGVEYREDELNSVPDEISQVAGGGFTGVGGATLPVSGKIDVSEFFSEFEVPLLTGASLAQELTLRGQFRYSDYSGSNGVTPTSFDANAYGLSLAWVPVDELRLRAQFQRAVRAPNVIELYTGQNTGLPNLSSAGTNANGTQLFDPCASNAPLESLDVCQRSGVTAAQYGTILDVISGQTQSLTGGNPLLSPEEADTTTFGVVYTPTQVEGLSISLDYFDIVVDEAIAAGIPAQTTLDNCLATGNPVFCNLITRGSDGSLAAGEFGVGFAQTNINIAELTAKGFDVQVIYDFDYGVHSFNIDYATTLLDELDTVPFPGGDPIKCAGFYGSACGSPSAEYRHRAKATWTTPWDVDVTATWRHFGETDNDNPTDMIERTLHDTNYIDVSANWNVMDNMSIRASVLNLFGEDPPIFTSAGPALGNGNTYPTVFDTSTAVFAGFKVNY